MYSSNCQRTRTADLFALRQFFLKYVSIPAEKYLAQREKFLVAGHIFGFQIHPICTGNKSIRTSIDFLIPHVRSNDLLFVAIHNCKVICDRGGTRAICNVQTADLSRGFVEDTCVEQNCTVNANVSYRGKRNRYAVFIDSPRNIKASAAADRRGSACIRVDRGAVKAKDAAGGGLLSITKDEQGEIAAGDYVIRVIADKTDNTEIKLTIFLTVVDGTEPATQIAVTSPAEGATFKEDDSVTLTANVATADSQPVTKVEVIFWINGTALGRAGDTQTVAVSADGTATVTVKAQAANHFTISGTNTIKASYRAVPGAYAASESKEITVTVNEAADVTANLQFTPSSIEKKIQLTNNTAYLKWDAATNTLTVLSNFTTKMPIVFTGFGAPVTLDLNGHTVTTDVPGYGNYKVVDQYGLILRDGSVVTIKDSSEGKNGAFVSTWAPSIWIPAAA